MKRVILGLSVIAVVSSALAFKAPTLGLYCGSQTQNSGCIVIKKREATGATNFFVKPDFNGSNCTASDCPTPIRLIDQN